MGSVAQTLTVAASQFVLQLAANHPQRLQLEAGCFPEAAMSVVKEAIHQALMLGDGNLDLIQGDLQFAHLPAHVDNHESAIA